MSADNMIAILRTEVHPSLEAEHEEGRTGEKERHRYEYRVVEICLSATPFRHDEDGGNEVLLKDADAAVRMFEEADAYNGLDVARARADRLLCELGYVEYGIRVLELEMSFRELVEKAQRVRDGEEDDEDLDCLTPVLAAGAGQFGQSFDGDGDGDEPDAELYSTRVLH